MSRRGAWWRRRGRGEARLLGVLAVAWLAAAPGGAADGPTPAPGAAPVEIATRVEPKTVPIGTPFRYTMRITSARDVELVVPQLVGRIGDFQVVDFGGEPPQEIDGRTVLERWYTLVTYAAGDAIVPGPTIQYRTPGTDLQSVAAPDALVIVESLLSGADGEPVGDLRDIKGPVPVPRDYTIVAWIALAAAGLVAAVAMLFWAVNRRRRGPLIPPRPAHELALEALARLHAARLLEAGRHDEFYVRLSQVVRTYLEARFHLRAPEMTTEEFLQAAQRDPQLSPAQRGLLGQFLAEADLVKFARHVPAAEDAERAYRAAREFVQSTAPKEDPRAAA